ncbi:PucR family transcriptional regulator ligand-binding domain-containing protein [Paraburkholderia sp. MPAMCS5]|uniref:PucR family transcriptional regulator n=1 Tax=Paraburkholderia sp. MPAMCS5 TaxID=3112563 RepID=UPI002E17EA54|nr:PucR family transcriptional regulator ligand-binding domain-containing protein [Paraburkholderia sp. MPAMCS5]
MKLDTAIRETVLREAEVVAGEENLQRDITWVHMVDHPDIVNWVKPGELLLTTGYNWPSDTEASRRLVRDLSKVGLAGVVLAVPHFRDHFPQEAIDEARSVGFPLLELPWAVQFSQVTHEILAKIINFQAEIIERSEQMHRALTNAAVTANSLGDIAITLKKLVGREVTFTNISGEMLGTSAAESETQALEEQFLTSLSDGPIDSSSSSRPIRVKFVFAGRALYRLRLPVRLHDSLVAVNWLDLDGAEVDELDTRAMEHASVVAALHLMHQQQLAQQEDRLGYALVAGLLDGEFTSTPSALERARVCGWSQAGQYRICLVLLDEPIPLTTEGLNRRERWVESLKHQLRATGQPELLAIWLNQIKFILPADASPETLWDAVSDQRAAMAISRVHSGVDGMATGSKDVDALLPTLRPGRLHRFDEILFPRALLGDANARDMLIERLVTPLVSRPRGESLLETLCTLADEGFQLVNAARSLGIHISTMRYRLERIEEILNVTLEDPKIRFQVQVAMALYRLRED